MKKLILDTQIFLWWLTDSEDLGRATRAMICDSQNSVFISAVTIWELSIKRKQGIIKGLPEMNQLIEEEGFEELTIDGHHAQFAAEYGGDDLFRTALIAQTQTEGMTLVTTDNSYIHFGIRIWDARR